MSAGESTHHDAGFAWSVADLAQRFGLEIKGDGTRRIHGLATLRSAGPEHLGFLANAKYREQLIRTRAGAVILPEAAAADCPATAIISSNPYLTWAEIAELLHPAPSFEPGIHAMASIDTSASIAGSACVAAGAIIGPHCRIGPGAHIGAGCVLEENVQVGAHARLVARVFVGRGTRIGQRVLIHPGAVIGADGFGLAMDQGHWRKVPQMGNVSIGDDCEIGANTTIDRGAIEDTVLEEDVRIDNQVQIAHNVHIGAHTAIAGCTGIAGSTRIGRYCMIAGACGISGHLEIGDRVTITAMSTVLHSITGPGEYGSGIPARPQRAWQRILIRLKALDGLARRLKALERRLP